MDADPEDKPVDQTFWGNDTPFWRGVLIGAAVLVGLACITIPVGLLYFLAMYPQKALVVADIPKWFFAGLLILAGIFAIVGAIIEFRGWLIGIALVLAIIVGLFVNAVVTMLIVIAGLLFVIVTKLR